MKSDEKQALLQQIPPITELLKDPVAAGWLQTHPGPLITDCLRRATAQVREQVLAQAEEGGPPPAITAELILGRRAVQDLATIVCRALFVFVSGIFVQESFAQGPIKKLCRGF